MANLNSLGSIAEHIQENFNQIPEGVSGNMIEIVDQARQHVENYTGNSIGSNSIDNKYQPIIIDFTKADTIDLINAQSGGEKIKLGDLSVEETGEALSAKQYRLLAESKLKNVGKSFNFSKSLT